MKKQLLLAFALTFSSQLIASSDKALEAFEQKKYVESKSLFNAQPDTPQKHYYLGRIAISEKKLDEAEELLQKAIKLDQKNDKYHYWLGMVNLRQAANASIFTAPGYASDARENLEQSIKLNPNNLDSMKGLVSFYLNVPAIAGGSTDKALDMANRMEPISRMESYISKIAVFREKEEKLLEIEIANKLIVDYSDSPRALVKAGFTFQSHKDYQKAFELFEKASNLKAEKDDTSTLSALYQIGRTAVLSKVRAEDGIKALESYLEKEISESLPSKNWARYRLASLYQSTKQFDKAISNAKLASKDKDEKMLRSRAKRLLKSLKKSKV